MSAPEVLFQRIRSILIESGDRFAERFSPRRFEFRVEGRSGPIPLYLTVFEETELIVVHSVAPFVAKVSDYSRIVDFLARANDGLSEGTFELSFSSGQLRVRTSLYVEQPHLSARLLRKVVMTNALLMAKYLPALGRVVLDGESPETAIGRAEGGS
jgi:hypothetical protein